MTISTCCKKISVVLVEYDIGSLGIRTFKVCQEHLQKEPWNKFIISTKNIGDV